MKVYYKGDVTEMFSTRDLYLTAFLITDGFKLIKHEKEKDIFFFFEKTEKLEIQVAAYYSLQSAVIPKMYANTLKSLKNIINGYATPVEVLDEG